MSDTTARDLAAVEADLARLSAAHPSATVFAMMEVFVDISCGDNPALRDFKRLQIYRGIRHKLAQRGIR